MYEKSRDVTLKNGESVELGVMIGPDDSDLARQLRGLLGHKGVIWKWQIEQSLGRVQKGVESRFYIACRGGTPISNVMVVEWQGIGIFGHVYTRPEERRKGLADAIITFLMEDFRRRGGRALYLGTGFDSAAYHIYGRHGFGGLEPGSGYMGWFAQGREAFEKEAFAPAATRQEALTFEHWPTLPALSMMQHPARVRIPTMNVINARSTEGGALPVLMAMHNEANNEKEEGSRAQVAVSQSSGVPVAIACVMPESHFWKDVDVLDVFCAPGFEAELPALVERLQLVPDRTLASYADLCWPAKQEFLRTQGFKRAAKLARYFHTADQTQDVELWTRRTRAATRRQRAKSVAGSPT